MCVFTHKYTVGLSSQNYFLHTHHTVSLQTQDDMDTVLLSEHITTLFKKALCDYFFLLVFSILCLIVLKLCSNVYNFNNLVTDQESKSAVLSLTMKFCELATMLCTMWQHWMKLIYGADVWRCGALGSCLVTDVGQRVDRMTVAGLTSWDSIHVPVSIFTFVTDNPHHTLSAGTLSSPLITKTGTP